jgi:putative transposase
LTGGHRIQKQIITVLREQEAGAKAADLARKHRISEATLYNWKAKYDGIDVSDAKRLKALEGENVKLKKLPADQMLEAALKELVSKKCRARREVRSRRASTGRHRPVRTAGLFHRRRGSEDGALLLLASAGDRTARRLRELANERRASLSPAVHRMHPMKAAGFKLPRGNMRAWISMTTRSTIQSWGFYG